MHAHLADNAEPDIGGENHRHVVAAVADRRAPLAARILPREIHHLWWVVGRDAPIGWKSHSKNQK